MDMLAVRYAWTTGLSARICPLLAAVVDAVVAAAVPLESCAGVALQPWSHGSCVIRTVPTASLCSVAATIRTGRTQPTSQPQWEEETKQRAEEEGRKLGGVP